MPNQYRLGLRKSPEQVGAAWKDYLRRAPGGFRGKSPWAFLVREVMEKHGYTGSSSRLYLDFTEAGLTDRRSTLNVNYLKRPQLPRCPGVPLFCKDCTLIPPCKDFVCMGCDKEQTCACQQPKSQEWTGAMRAFYIETEAKLGRHQTHEDLYGTAIDWDTDTYSHGNICELCEGRVSNNGTLCKKDANRVSGKSRKYGVSKEDAIEMVREEFYD